MIRFDWQAAAWWLRGDNVQYSYYDNLNFLIN